MLYDVFANTLYEICICIGYRVGLWDEEKKEKNNIFF